MAYVKNPTPPATRIQEVSYTAAQAPVPTPSTGIDEFEAVYTITAAVSETWYSANRTAVQGRVKNSATSTAALTLSPKSGETFDGGSTALVLQPGDSYNLDNPAGVGGLNFVVS